MTIYDNPKIIDQAVTEYLNGMYESQYDEIVGDAIIVDLDGTLSDCTKRTHFVEQTPKDYKSFFENLINDSPNEWCLKIVQQFTKDTEIFYITSRPEECRTLTETWFKKWGIELKTDNLFMRKPEDLRKDFEIKKEIYETQIKGKFNVLFAIDDRKQVVDMWRANNIVCLQCAEGNF